MMNNKKSRTVEIILGGLGKKPSMPEMESDDMEDSDDMQMEYQAAADDVLSAIESKDSAALAEALQAFVTLCREV